MIAPRVPLLLQKNEVNREATKADDSGKMPRHRLVDERTHTMTKLGAETSDSD